MLTIVHNINIFDIPLSTTITNPVNTVGAMGAGLAKQFRLRYPGIMQNYTARCRDGSFTVGKLLIYHAPDGRDILLFPTKADWRNPSRIEYVEAGLDAVVRSIHRFRQNDRGLVSIAFPPLGCGLGGLKTDDIIPLFQSRFADRSDSDIMLLI